MVALATTLDLAKRGIALSVGESDLAATYLDVASEHIRQAAGVQISQQTSTVELEGSIDVWLRPPGVPITAVSDVELDDVAVTDWLLRSGALWREIGWASALGRFGARPSKVVVTYTHGLVLVPADIVDLVCRLAAAALVAWRSTPDGSGLASVGIERQVTLGDYSVTYAADGRITEMTLPALIRDQLAARFGQTAQLVRSR